MEGRHGWWVSWVSGRWPVFTALNIDTPNRWEDLYKREAIARDILISIRALPPNKSMQPTAKASAELNVSRTPTAPREKRNQTILAAKEKPLTVAYWESAYLRRLAGLNVMPSSFEGCLMQTSQKSGINYLDIFRLNTFRISAAIRTVADWANIRITTTITTILKKNNPVSSKYAKNCQFTKPSNT